MFIKKRRILLARIWIVLFIFLAGLGFRTVVKAEGEYYATWKEYKESGAPSANWEDVANAMDTVFEHAKEVYKAGDAKGAYDSVNHGYYGYYETTGFERLTLGKISGARKSEVELQFAACKAVTKNNGSTDEFNKEIDKLKSMIRNDAAILDGKKPTASGKGNAKAGSADEATIRQVVEEVLAEQSGGSTSAATATFIACFSIILREGFEAILIVGAIIAYLIKSSGGDAERKKKLTRPVYIGSLVGIVASFALAWLLDVLTLANSASQEIIEGVTALTAVVVL